MSAATLPAKPVELFAPVEKPPADEPFFVVNGSSEMIWLLPAGVELYEVMRHANAQSMFMLCFPFSKYDPEQIQQLQQVLLNFFRDCFAHGLVPAAQPVDQSPGILASFLRMFVLRQGTDHKNNDHPEGFGGPNEFPFVWKEELPLCWKPGESGEGGAWKLPEGLEETQLINTLCIALRQEQASWEGETQKWPNIWEVRQALYAYLQKIKN